MPKKKINFIFIAMILFTIGMYTIGISKNIETCDYWWHIKAGEWMTNNNTVPTKDIFSWYGVANQLDWSSHEWLSEVLLYIPHILFGKASGYMVASALLVLTGVLIYIFNKDNYKKNLIFSMFWTIIGVSILISTFNPRPHMFSYILFLITLKIIFTFIEKENSKLIWFIPVISVLWSNLHGGSSNLPYVLCLIALVTGLIEKDLEFIKLKKMDLKKLKTLALVIVTSILSIAINPHGLEMITYPYTNMADTLMLNVISEWRAPDLKLLGDYPIYILLFVVYMTLLKRNRALVFSDLTYMLAFTYLTLKSVRFAPFLYAVSTFIIFKYINKNECDEKVFSIGAILIGLLCSLGTMPSIKDSYTYFADMKLVSDSVIESVKNEDIKRIYNDYDLGGYLIYNDIEPFIDGRADVYSKNILKDYHIINTMTLNAIELIGKYDFDAFLVQNGSAIDNYVKNNKSYIKILNDENYNLYKKTLVD